MGKSYKKNYSDSMYDGFGNSHKANMKKQKRYNKRDILSSYYNRDEDNEYDDYKRKGSK